MFVSQIKGRYKSVTIIFMCTFKIQISVEFRNLAQEYRDVISDICHRMGVGMAEFLEKKVGSMKEWDLVNGQYSITVTARVQS